MKIAFLCETYPRNMGYLGTMLPKYLAKLGADVHVLALDLPPYWQMPSMRDSYRRLAGTGQLKVGSIEQVDGYTVHVMRHKKMLGHMAMSGLSKKLKSICPDITYSLTAIGWLPVQAALAKPRYHYKLFTGSHTTESTFRPAKLGALHPARAASFILRWLPGRLVSFFTERCYAPTVDAAEIAWRFFGVQRRKVGVMHLGVDTEFFYPVRDDHTAAARASMRSQWGIAEDTVLCIYTGKFSEEKNPLILARAAAALTARGQKFRAVFVGNGPQKDALAAMDGTIVLPFVPYHELGEYYRAADVAVWPTNESTSMLDAAACGLPLIVSDGIVYRDHVDGNGLVYAMNDLSDLEVKLGQLAEERTRQQLGRAGAEKMAEHFSWAQHAEKRFVEYQEVLKRT